MKAPSLCILAAFSAGILAGNIYPVRPFVAAVAGCTALIAALVLWAARFENWSFAASLVGWIAIGVVSLSFSQRSQPANLASSLIESAKLDASAPLRWQGALRENPERLPYGMRFTVDLDRVSSSGQTIPVTGGLRATLYAFGDSRDIPEIPQMELRAGDRVELIAQAHVPRNYKDPGAFDYRAQLARQGIVLTASLRSLQLIHRLPGPPPKILHWLARARGDLLARVDTLVGAGTPQAAVLRAMLLGDRNFVDNEVADNFRKTSSFHVLVIAGLHVGALAAFAVWAGKKMRLGRPAASVLTLTILASYAAIVQDRPPILRATLMAAVYLLARAFFRRMDTLQVAAVAALAILFWRPGEIVDPSWQFSFLAIGAIGGIALPWLDRTAEPLRRALFDIGDSTRDPAHSPKLAQLRLDLRSLAATISRKLPGRLRPRAPAMVTRPMRAALLLWEAFVISAVIQIGLMPLLAGAFHRVSFTGPIANIGAVLLTGIIVPAGFAALALSYLSMPAGRLLARIAAFGVSLLTKSIGWFAKPQWGNVRVPDAPIWVTLCFFAGLIGLAFFIRGQKKWGRWLSAAVVSGCAILMVLSPFAPRLARGQMEFAVLDVGQGDSLFLAAPDGHTLLTDGGGGPGPLRIQGMQTRFDVGEEVVSRYLWSRGIKRLDTVALTHAHEDHIDGLFAVLENFRVGELWVGHDVGSPPFRHLLELARARGTKVVHLERGNSFSWGALHGTVLWPNTTSEVENPTNDDSLVLRIALEAQSIFLAGDIERPVERTLVEEGVLEETTFLKVPHHGSATSSTPPFLIRLRPSAAAISVGENNPFNHPSPDVILRLRNMGVVVYRTDQDGAITLTTDGITSRIETFVGTRHSEGGAASAFLPR